MDNVNETDKTPLDLLPKSEISKGVPFEFEPGSPEEALSKLLNDLTASPTTENFKAANATLQQNIQVANESMGSFRFVIAFLTAKNCAETPRRSWELSDPNPRPYTYYHEYIPSDEQVNQVVNDLNELPVKRLNLVQKALQATGIVEYPENKPATPDQIRTRDSRKGYISIFTELGIDLHFPNNWDDLVTKNIEVPSVNFFHDIKQFKPGGRAIGFDNPDNDTLTALKEEKYELALIFQAQDVGGYNDRSFWEYQPAIDAQLKKVHEANERLGYKYKTVNVGRWSQEGFLES